jgi:hypothetical protein
VVLEWEDGTLFFGEGDSLTGPLHTSGLQSLNVEGRGMMTVRYETWLPDLVAANRCFGNGATSLPVHLWLGQHEISPSTRPQKRL